MTKPQVWTALVTPFDADGKIDFEDFARLVDEQVLAGIDGVVVAGTTGEGPTLSLDEKLKLLASAKHSSAGRLKVMVGTGTNHTQESVVASQKAKEHGADCILVVTPPYNKPSLAGLTAHIEAIGKAADIPICLYHVPGRTAQRLDADTLAQLSQHPKIASIKEASGDIGLFSSLRQKCDRIVLSGDDFSYLPSLSVGGNGVISVVTNIFPKAFVVLTQLFAQNKNQAALDIHNALYPFIEALFFESNPIPAKFALGLKGYRSCELRLPLVSLGANFRQEFEKHYQTCLAKLGSLDLV